jgi:cation diffusion facilitator CzcD-associated flavoprotein CzcO
MVQRKILIVGAGIGGLGAAAVLRQESALAAGSIQIRKHL